MGLIENQRATIEAEIKAARREQRAAERAAEAQHSIFKWAKKNPSWSCEANFQILQGYLANAGILVTEDSLDLAFQACRAAGQLAERVPTPVAPELTAQEKLTANNERLRGMSVAELRKEVQEDIKRKLA